MSNRINDTRLAGLLSENNDKSFGSKGHVYLVPASATTIPNVVFYAIQVLEDSVVTYKDGTTLHSETVLPKYDTVYGLLNEIEVVSGRIRVYLK